MQSAVVYSLNHDTTTSFGLRLTPIFQNLTPTCTGISVRVHPYAHPQRVKVLKHFIYIHMDVGCTVSSGLEPQQMLINS
jgi:hypothetical protein